MSQRLKPIPYSPPMVLAKQAGLKTQTRRLVNTTTPKLNGQPNPFLNASDRYIETRNPEWLATLAPFRVGDVLWTREAFRLLDGHDQHSAAQVLSGYLAAPLVRYEADGAVRWPSKQLLTSFQPGMPYEGTWQPPFGRYRQGRFMPRHMARFWDLVTDVRLQRVQDISREDSLAEGIDRWRETRMASQPEHYRLYWVAPGDESLYTSDPRDSFESLWISINGPESWQQNPWVWAITFQPITMPETWAKYLSK